jgi:catechol 2,3-dioxygenase-like lactoylglutathione lyase family enzyme
MSGRRLATVALVVGDYDEAVRWYTEKLGFAHAEDADLGGGKRRVFLFLETDNFDRDHEAMLAKDVSFREEPRHEAYGTVAVFADLYGNLWDLIEPKR